MKSKLNKIRADLEAALEMVGTDNGVTFDIGRMTYSHDSFRVTLEAFEATDGKSHKEVEFEKGAYLFGLEGGDFGKTFKSNGREYVICGLAMKSHKFPVLASRDGKIYKFIAGDVQRALGRSRIPGRGE